MSFSAPVVQAISSTLHAMAQPLTVLQSCVLLATMPDLLKSASPDLLQDLAGEVQRLSATYAGLRDLLSLGQCTPASQPVHIADALHDLSQERESAKRMSKLHLTDKHPLACVLVDRTRLLHVLRTIVGIAADLSPPQSSVDLVIQIQPCTETLSSNIILKISAEADLTHLDFARSLSFAVADALLQADGATMSFERRPLVATLILPRAPILNSHCPAQTTVAENTTYEGLNLPFYTVE